MRNIRDLAQLFLEGRENVEQDVSGTIFRGAKEMGVYFLLKTEGRKMSRIRRRKFWSGAGGTGSQGSNFYNYFLVFPRSWVTPWRLGDWEIVRSRWKCSASSPSTIEFSSFPHIF